MKQTSACPHCHKMDGLIQFVVSRAVIRVAYWPDGKLKKRQETQRTDMPRKMWYCGFCLQAVRTMSVAATKAEAAAAVEEARVAESALAAENVAEEKEPELSL